MAYIGNSVGGMAGIKHVSRNVCELKRLYVSPLYRRVGLGRSLVERLLAAARILGYSKIRLETLDFMEAAIRLYESLGFSELLSLKALRAATMEFKNMRFTLP